MNPSDIVRRRIFKCAHKTDEQLRYILQYERELSGTLNWALQYAYRQGHLQRLAQLASSQAQTLRKRNDGVATKNTSASAAGSGEPDMTRDQGGQAPEDTSLNSFAREKTRHHARLDKPRTASISTSQTFNRTSTTLGEGATIQRQRQTSLDTPSLRAIAPLPSRARIVHAPPVGQLLTRERDDGVHDRRTPAVQNRKKIIAASSDVPGEASGSNQQGNAKLASSGRNKQASRSMLAEHMYELELIAEAAGYFDIARLVSVSVDSVSERRKSGWRSSCLIYLIPRSGYWTTS